jgi:hypothetical protein
MLLLSFVTGNQHLTLVEVKSTCDTPHSGMKMSDAKTIKNSKRSAQHQLRDHVELLQASMEMGACKTNGSKFGTATLFFL